MTTPQVIAGDDADRVVDEARKKTNTRRDLSRSESFEQVSPDVGEFDQAAFEDLLAEDPDEALTLLTNMTQATDKALGDRARELAAQLFIDKARSVRPDVGGVGRVVVGPYQSDGGDLDLDGSIDGLLAARAERRAVDVDDLRVSTWRVPATSWCLLVDRSGSMNGKPVATAALAAAAVATRVDGDYAVLCFGREVVAAKAIWEARTEADVVDRILALRGHGTTDVANALRAASAQLATSSAGRRVTILLSDCRSTEPGDVVGAALAVEELVIIAPSGDSDDAVELSDAVGARLATVSGPSDIVRAIAAVLGD